MIGSGPGWAKALGGRLTRSSGRDEQRLLQGRAEERQAQAREGLLVVHLGQNLLDRDAFRKGWLGGARNGTVRTPAMAASKSECLAASLDLVKSEKQCGGPR